MDDEHVYHATEHADLKRGIGPWLLFVGGAIWSAFLCAFVLAIFTAASYAELVTKYPRASGSAT